MTTQKYVNDNGVTEIVKNYLNTLNTAVNIIDEAKADKEDLNRVENQLSESITNLESDLNELIAIEASINHIDINTAQTGFVAQDGSLMTNGAWGNYISFEAKKLKPSTKYLIYPQDRLSSGKYRFGYALFGNDGSVKGYSNTDGVPELSFTTTADTTSAIVSFIASTANAPMLVEGETRYGVYEPYTELKYIAIPRQNGTININELSKNTIETLQNPVMLHGLNCINFATNNIPGLLRERGEIEDSTSYYTSFKTSINSGTYQIYILGYGTSLNTPNLRIIYRLSDADNNTISYYNTDNISNTFVEIK